MERTYEQVALEGQWQQFERAVEDAIAEIINHPLTPKMAAGAETRMANIIKRHLMKNWNDSDKFRLYARTK